MLSYLYTIIILISVTVTSCYAESTQRIPSFNNDKVNVWKTIIYPSQHQILKMHRHENDRIVVAFNDGTLKIVNNKGMTHYLTLKKETAYFLKKDIAGQFHTDENITNHPIRVLVIEFKPNK